MGRREFAQLAVFTVLGERVRRAQQALQQTSRRQPSHCGDGGVEAGTVAAEPAVRLRPETIQ